jgi:CheY-like chemotaxis protein
MTAPPPQLAVLIVDDAATNRIFLCRALRRQLPTAELVEAENGAVAVATVAADVSRFHMVSMDKEMPVMDGHTATARLRQLGYRGLIVGVTGDVHPDEVAEFRRAGADAVLGKPVRVPQLLGLLQQHVAAARPAP